METLHLKEKINKGLREFHGLTFFPAGWIKCNLYTRNILSSLIIENNRIEGTDLVVIIDYDIPDGIARIGMGMGPTYSEVKF